MEAVGNLEAGRGHDAAKQTQNVNLTRRRENAAGRATFACVQSKADPLRDLLFKGGSACRHR